ncbi:TPA: DUF1433 domain-containing protein [Staphylococcus aureus]|uniref:DUF1433 domain-containing protein n=1 Tax=Staphylococcus aureus TaxID=1280 RepID=UPI0009319971|nr:DUF1433 domain-containing protein [Staphylococcus aureus]MVG42705.1 DUF1433 domain-containing protein [Staphylococcus aureus]MVG75418.1 DUF1433 domain-containing protein [Staphylococcus aureus]PZG96275.1 DUF1433 domain-containing protein [Staphylococcus aureus]QNW86025.1 DUF1433 domain-containing protein [Staphylococcus aureus]
MIILNKKNYYIAIIIISILLIIGGVYLKMKHDEKEKYYNEQKERITIYMKHNVKGYKNISFTNFKENSMDGYSISGYINNDKKLSFTAGIRSIDDFQFDTDISYTDELGRKLIKNPKSVSEIKKEQNTSNK